MQNVRCEAVSKQAIQWANILFLPLTDLSKLIGSCFRCDFVECFLRPIYESSTALEFDPQGVKVDRFGDSQTLTGWRVQITRSNGLDSNALYLSPLSWRFFLFEEIDKVVGIRESG